jgi:hypothetical protein
MYFFDLGRGREGFPKWKKSILLEVRRMLFDLGRGREGFPKWKKSILLEIRRMLFDLGRAGVGRNGNPPNGVCVNGPLVGRLFPNPILN